MKTLSLSSLFSVIFSLQILNSTYASQVIEQIEVTGISNEQLSSEISLRSKRTGFLSFLFKTKELMKNTEVKNNVIIQKLAKPVNLSRVDFSYKLTSSKNLSANESRSVVLKGKIYTDKNTITGREAIFKNTILKKFRPDVKCSPKYAIDGANKKLVLDFSKIESLSACEGNDVAYYSERGIGHRNVGQGSNFYKPQDDVALGEQFVSSFNKENASLIYPKNHPMTVYLQNKMEIIARNSDEPTFRPRVYVINADVINAFALPGGAVYVYRGLLERSPNEAALMGVLGHEWAHVTARHGTKNMTHAIKLIYGGMLVYIAANIAADMTKDQLLKIGYQVLGVTAYIGSNLLLMKHSRDAESEADRIGSQYALLSGYSPLGLAYMFGEFKKLSPEVTSLEKILSTHPSHDDRIEQNKIVSSLFYPVDRNYIVEPTDDYLIAQSDLKTMPLPSKEVSEKVATSFVGKLKDVGDNEIALKMRERLQEIKKENSQGKREN